MSAAKRSAAGAKRSAAGAKRPKKHATPGAGPPREERKPGPAAALSGQAARYLRALGHHLDAIVQIGKEGITEGVVNATREALLTHELVTVKVSRDAPIDRKVAGEELAARSGSVLAQTLGRTLLLYKRHPHKPGIVLPR